MTNMLAVFLLYGFILCAIAYPVVKEDDARLVVNRSEINVDFVTEKERRIKLLWDRIQELHRRYTYDTHFRLDYRVTSTIRTVRENKRVGGVPNSPHLTGRAIDVLYHNDDFAIWLLKNEKYLKDLDLYIAHPAYGIHIHYTSRPPKSGKRIFIPYNNKKPRKLNRR